jgi:hypothetical protein
MNIGRALLVGLQHVDSGAYDGDEFRNGCLGSELDVDNMQLILSKEGYRCHVLKTEAATATAVLDALRQLATDTQAGDICVFYFSGHGGQHPDVNGDEDDGEDETLFCFDRCVIDDELGDIWRSFRADARIFMISDSCNSGTNFKIIETLANEPAALIPMPDELDGPLQASLLHIGAARDGMEASGYQSGGAFTQAICDVWQAGNFQGSYETLFARVQARVAEQFPQFNQWGINAAQFAKQRPFQI